MIQTPPPPDAPPSLRDALIEAGMALLAEGGMANLTLRRAAARAGVSHAAPAHHFDGLPGLLTAIATRAFRSFADTLYTAREAAGADPMARLNGTCQGYLTFAATHAGLFHLMFVSPEVNRADPILTPQAIRSYQILREACAPFVKTARATPKPADLDPCRIDARSPDNTLEVAVWSMVHGYASLGFGRDGAQGGPFSPPPGFPQLLAKLLGPR